ncbi:MAG: hypothetical protein M0R03_19880, partial [Novosphingobium sp.]|nr:hypothetical protein [Novosphingobium sp.]
MIKFGASVHSLSDFYFDLILTPQVLTTYKFFEYWVKDNVDIVLNDIHYDLQFIVYDDDRSNVKENYLKLIEEDEVDVLFNLGSVESAYISAEVANDNQVPIILLSPRPDVYENKTTVFNPYLNAYSQLHDILPLLRISGVKSVHVLEMSNSTVACFNIDEIFDMNFITDVTKTVYSEYDEEFLPAIDKIIELDKDLLLYCDMNQTNFNELTRLLTERRYMPKAGLNLMLDKFSLNETWSDYWMMYHSTVQGVKQPETKYLKTFENIKMEMGKFFQEYPKYTIDLDKSRDNIFNVITILELGLDAIINANSLERYKIIDSIKRSDYDSFIGKVSFTSDNRQLVSGIGYQQLSNGTKNILLPATLANDSIIYPAPTFDERIKSTKITAIEIAVYVFIGLIILNSIAWIVYIILNFK